jgi:predicted porin
MDMFGGLTKTSSRIAIAAALGLTLGGFAFKATPAKAADLGGDCCADLEERVAELEATTVRKGNKKVSVTLSGWVVKDINWWDDGDIDHFVVGDKDYDLGTRFAITGSATIAPGWSAGFNITVNTWSDIFGYQGGFGPSDQFDDLGGTFGNINTLYSYIYIKSDRWGTLNWGHLSPASDNPAVLADISGTVIESNGVWFEGSAFLLRPKGGKGLGGLSAFTWGDFLTCNGLGIAGIGVDCWGAAQPAVRYDSPTWGGFRFETSYGKNQLTNAFDSPSGVFFNSDTGKNFEIDTSDQDFWDIAVFYTGDWNSIKLSAAAAYTWIETSRVTVNDRCFSGEREPCGQGDSGNLFQVGATIMHKPSGLGIYGMYQHEETDGKLVNFENVGPFDVFSIPDTDAWYVKPFWRKTWSPIGATVLYGEYGEYHDQFGGLVGVDLEDFGNQGETGPAIPGCFFPNVFDCYVTGSEARRWGLGVVQEIDSAAMHLWVRWQHQDLDVDIKGIGGEGGDSCGGGDPNGTCKIHTNFDDFDLFQAGGIIFF